MSIEIKVGKWSMGWKRSVATVIVGTAFASSLASAQDKKKPDWKDPAWNMTFISPSPRRRIRKSWLDSIDKWTKQYPQSELGEIRRQLYLETYRQLNRPREAFNAAIEVLRDNPNNLFALSTVVGSVYQLNPAAPADLDVAERATTTILANLDGIYAKENRPTEVTDADAFVKSQAGDEGFYTKNGRLDRLDPEAISLALRLNYGKAIEMDPNQGQVSYWLADAILEQNKTNPEKQPAAIYCFARAAAYDGPGALPASDRKNLTAYLTTAYVKYHGSEEGLPQLLSDTKSSALPPSGFQIRSAAQIAKERFEAEQMFDKTHPERALWKDLGKPPSPDPAGGNLF